MPMGVPQPLMDRFIDKLLVMPNGCWHWTAEIDKRTGYARIGGGSGGARNMGAHRAAYELFVGPIPEGLTLDHLCRVRHCVNPSHLEPVSNRENILRGKSPSARAARQTHCVHGHEFTVENTYRGRGHRECRECGRQKNRVQRAQRA